MGEVRYSKLFFMRILILIELNIRGTEVKLIRDTETSCSAQGKVILDFFLGMNGGNCLAMNIQF